MVKEVGFIKIRKDVGVLKAFANLVQ